MLYKENSHRFPSPWDRPFFWHYIFSTSISLRSCARFIESKPLVQQLGLTLYFAARRSPGWENIVPKESVRGKILVPESVAEQVSGHLESIYTYNKVEKCSKFGERKCQCQSCPFDKTEIVEYIFSFQTGESYLHHLICTVGSEGQSRSTISTTGTHIITSKVQMY